MGKLTNFSNKIFIPTVGTKNLFVGKIVQITDVKYTGTNFINRETHFLATTIETQRIFYNYGDGYSFKREYGEYTDVLTGNVYKKYASESHNVGDLVADILFPIVHEYTNVPCKISGKRAYLMAVYFAGCELSKEDIPSLRKVFKKK